jgi:hypothetical protein
MSNFADFSLSTGRDGAGGRPHPCLVPVSSNGANISPIPIPIPGGSPIPVGAVGTAKQGEKSSHYVHLSTCI